MAEPITISFLLKQGDQMDASWYVLLHNRAMRILAIILLLFLVSAFFANFAQVSEGDRLRFILIPIVLIAFLGTSIFWQRRRIARGDAAFRDPMRYSFSASGIDVAGSTFTGHRDWDGITQGAETRRLYLLFISPRVVYIVPKHAFADNAQRAAFVALVCDRLGKRAKLRD
jgi:YcxB-like protein